MVFNKIIKIIVLLIFISSICLANIPYSINYQGKLFDETGMPVTAVKFFKIMLKEDGVSTINNCTWEKDVQVINGIFSIVLTFSGTNDKEQNPFAYLAADEDVTLELEVWVNNQKLVPNKKFNAVPYALSADQARGVYDGRIEGSKINPLDVDHSDTAYVRANDFRFGKNRGDGGIALQSNGDELVINQNGGWTDTRIKGNQVYIEGDLQVSDEHWSSCTYRWGYGPQCPDGHYAAGAYVSGSWVRLLCCRI